MPTSHSEVNIVGLSSLRILLEYCWFRQFEDVYFPFWSIVGLCNLRILLV